MVVTACGGDDGPTGQNNAGPGTVSAVLVSPNGAEGGAWVRLVGPGLGVPTAPAGALYSSRSGDTTEVVLLLETPGQITFTLSVPDTTDPPTVELVQVTDGSNALRTLTQGYDVSVVR
jgi:hypothetical protein